MADDLTNLLPSERRDVLSRDYFLRLSVVVIVIVAILAVVAMVLLLPTYVFLTESARAKEAQLATVETALSSSDEVALSARLAALSRDASALSALAKAPSASAIVRSALAISHPGITLSGLAYVPAGSKTPGTPSTKSDLVLGTLAISGNAATRDALRGYQVSLSTALFARAADLPVSAYAKDSNISFTITVTLAP